MARPAVLDGLRPLRSSAPVTELADAGHYPQIQAPRRLSEVVRKVLPAH